MGMTGGGIILLFTLQTGGGIGWRSVPCSILHYSHSYVIVVFNSYSMCDGGIPCEDNSLLHTCNHDHYSSVVVSVGILYSELISFCLPWVHSHYIGVVPHTGVVPRCALPVNLVWWSTWAIHTPCSTFPFVDSGGDSPCWFMPSVYTTCSWVLGYVVWSPSTTHYLGHDDSTGGICDHCLIC